MWGKTINLKATLFDTTCSPDALRILYTVNLAYHGLTYLGFSLTPDKDTAWCQMIRIYLTINNVTGISVYTSAIFYFSLVVPGKRGFLYTSLFQRCFTYGTRLKEQKMPKPNE